MMMKMMLVCEKADAVLEDLDIKGVLRCRIVGRPKSCNSIERSSRVPQLGDWLQENVFIGVPCCKDVHGMNAQGFKNGDNAGVRNRGSRFRRSGY
jgi:hypothetical protein